MDLGHLVRWPRPGVAQRCGASEDQPLPFPPAPCFSWGGLNMTSRGSTIGGNVPEGGDLGVFPRGGRRCAAPVRTRPHRRHLLPGNTRPGEPSLRALVLFHLTSGGQLGPLSRVHRGHAWGLHTSKAKWTRLRARPRTLWAPAHTETRSPSHPHWVLTQHASQQQTRASGAPHLSHVPPASTFSRASTSLHCMSPPRPGEGPPRKPRRGGQLPAP